MVAEWLASQAATTVVHYPGLVTFPQKGLGLDQHKSAQAHWAHMLVHGTLHLLGHDHVENPEAELMESLETDILQQLNLPNPYMLQSSGGSLARQ